MKTLKVSAIILSAFTLIACVTNPITGRKSFQFVSNAEISSAAASEYKTTLSSSKVITGTADAVMVKKVGENIKNAAYNYYKSIGRESDLTNYNWEFNLIKDDQINAWCMPGGKVAFYTGIMPVCKDEKGVAVVMGHEVSHALAGHGNERVSQQMIAQYGGAIIGGSITNSDWNNVFKKLYPVGTQVTLLKYGRNQELEADKMGLYIMAMAAYDPRVAPVFWERMKTASGASNTPEFLSTHPNPGDRIADLNAAMPTALQYYKSAGGKL